MKDSQKVLSDKINSACTVKKNTNRQESIIFANCARMSNSGHITKPNFLPNKIYYVAQ